MKRTKKNYIEYSMIYTKDSTVDLCFSYIVNVFRNLNITDIHFIDVYAGNGSFFKKLDGLSRVAYAPLGDFKEAIFANFLRVEEINTDKKYKFSIGFPPVREYEDYVNHAIKINSDFIAFISPISGGNKKNTLNYEEHEYTIVFNEQLPVNSYFLPSGEKWNQNLNFIIVSKNEHLEELYKVVEPKLTYGDIFNIYTINTTKIKIRETTHPYLFEGGKMPWSRNQQKYYTVLTDENGIKYYEQDGINIDKIGKCDLYIPLRYFPASNDRFEFHKEFNETMFGKIGFGLKLKDGYKIKSNFKKNLYIIYNERFKGVFSPIATMNEATIKSFYEMKRYNNGLYISNIKLIKRGKIGIKS